MVLCILTIGKYAIGQTIISNNGKYGIVDDNSKEIAVPVIYDEIKVHHKSPWENPRTDTRIYILKQGNKYTYAMKQFWKTTYFHRQTWEEIDSVKWFIDTIFFEELFPLGVFFGRPKYGKIYKGDTCLSLEQDYYYLGYKKNGKVGLITYSLNAKTLYNIHIPGHGYGDIDKRAIHFSLEEIQIHHAIYDSIMYLSIGNGTDNNFLVTLNSGKYGLIGLENNIEIEPQFDVAPVKLNLDPNVNSSIYEHSYYCVKKNGLWGIVYLSTKSNDFITCVPFNYQHLADIKNQNIRSIDFFELFTLDKDKTKQVQYQHKYISCVYNTLEDTTPIHFEFIIRDGETNLPTKRNSTNNEMELNKNYIPQTEKHITFIPTMNGKPVVQQREYEYLCTSNIYNIVSSYSGKLTTPLFVVLKMDRSEDVVNSGYDLYKRGETKKNVVYSAREYDYISKSPRLNYINRKPKAISIYRFANDSFIPLSEFNDEDNTTFEIVTEFMEDYESYYPEKKKVTYSSDFVLKSTQLESEIYKHEFYTFKGEKLYEITSKYPIDYWKFIETDPFRTSSYIPNEHFTLEFYTEIQGKKKSKKKIICSYNVKTKEFYK